MSHAVSITASYLKAALLPALRPLPASPIPTKDVFPSNDRSIFVFVSNCSDEIASDIHEFCSGRKLPIVHLDQWDEQTLRDGRLMGYLDPVLQRTLVGVAGLKECTAADLAARSSETISVNGWSNRLADLHQLRLLARRRQSKFWYYSPIVERISPWA